MTIKERNASQPAPISKFKVYLAEHKDESAKKDLRFSNGFLAEPFQASMSSKVVDHKLG